MKAKRQVRKDFDPAKQYSVDVSECTEAEKKEVQQAFFDAGLPWKIGGKAYRYLDAKQYTNVLGCGGVTAHIRYNNSTASINMTAKEFLALVYEPEKKGHVHAELMAQYAEDAKSHPYPWKLWQVKYEAQGEWIDLVDNPSWFSNLEYRRKPKTHFVHGVEIPVFEFTPEVGEEYYTANVGLPEFFQRGCRTSERCTFTQRMIERGLIYPHTEEGEKAAILHSKAMLGIA